MALLAAVFGNLSGNGIWYPMNLLVAGLLPIAGPETPWAKSECSISRRFLVAIPLHLLISLLVGLLYGVMLPMAPRRPILLGGFAAPLLWSFLIYGCLSVINPVMNQRIDWLWFVLSQIGFGTVAGIGSGLHGTNSHAAGGALWQFGGCIEASGLREERRQDHQEESRR